jgi:CTP:molybdopterin cytidylyltransferase MocA
MPPTAVVTGLVLAAGAGRRFGAPKALVPWRGGTLLDQAVSTLQDGGCAPVYAVVGASADDVAAATSTEFVSVRNDDWPSGMASSLRAGLAALPTDAGAVVIMLVDQPGISAVAVTRVREAHARGAPVAIATYGGRRAHPVLIDRAFWSDVAATAAGDAGAKDFLSRRPELIVEVDCTDAGTPFDIDTPEDRMAMTMHEEDERHA